MVKAEAVAAESLEQAVQGKKDEGRKILALCPLATQVVTRQGKRTTVVIEYTLVTQ